MNFLKKFLHIITNMISQEIKIKQEPTPTVQQVPTPEPTPTVQQVPTPEPTPTVQQVPKPKKIIPFDLKRLFINCRRPYEWQMALEKILPKYEITTKDRVCAFLAQTGHESAEYNILIENLNYSAQGLRNVFGRYFQTMEMAEKFARNPEMIANRVYASRIGNGNEASGDGWKFRGRGILQVTGRTNYSTCSEFMFGDNRLLNTPDILLEPDYAIESACWFWSRNNLNRIVDSGNFELLTRRINGGINGLAHRQELYARALILFN